MSSGKQTDMNSFSNVISCNTNLMKLHSLMTSLKSKGTVLIISNRNTRIHQKWINDKKKEHPALEKKCAVLQKTTETKPA